MMFDKLHRLCKTAKSCHYCSLRLIAAFSVFICGSVLSKGSLNVTVEYHASLDTRNVVDSSGNILADGNEVRIGYLKEGFDCNKDGANITAVANAWRSLGVTKIQTVFGEAGRYYDTCTYVEADFANKTICLWILKTSNNEPVSADFSNVTEYGLYSAMSGWKFPNPDSPPPANYVLLSSSEVDVALYGSYNQDSLILERNPKVSSGLSLVDWRNTVFPTDLDESLKTDAADPDNDGMPNVLEYFLGTNPLAKDGNSFEYSKLVVNNVTYLAITFKQAKDRSDATAKAITSIDLTHWQMEGIKQEVIAQDDKSQTTRILVPMDAPQRWLQLILQTK